MHLTVGSNDRMVRIYRTNSYLNVVLVFLMHECIIMAALGNTPVTSTLPPQADRSNAFVSKMPQTRWNQSLSQSVVWRWR